VSAEHSTLSRRTLEIQHAGREIHVLEKQRRAHFVHGENDSLGHLVRESPVDPMHRCG